MAFQTIHRTRRGAAPSPFSGIRIFSLITLNLFLLANSAPAPAPVPADQFKWLHHQTTDTKSHLAVGRLETANPIADLDGDLLYLKRHNNSTDKREVGIVRGKVEFPVFGSFASFASFDGKVGTVGVDSGKPEKGTYGAIVRGSAAEVTRNFGPGLSANKGWYAIDTGLKWDQGLEAKVLGFGGEISAKKVEVCVIMCFGFSW